LALPVRLGGLGISNPCKQCTGKFRASESVTAPLTNLILQQSHSYPAELKAKQINAQNNTRAERSSEKRGAKELMEKLPNSMQRSLSLAAEKGASPWLSTLPIEEHGFALHKSAFSDALCLRYGWQAALLPSHCVCGKKLSIDQLQVFFSCSVSLVPRPNQPQHRLIPVSRVGKEGLVTFVMFHVWMELCAIRISHAQIDISTSLKDLC